MCSKFIEDEGLFVTFLYLADVPLANDIGGIAGAIAHLSSQ
jgi:hypothetical protein